MVPDFYIRELFTWLKTDTVWSKWDKVQLVLWLIGWPYTGGAILVLLLLGQPWHAGLYVLNYPALWMFKPHVVRCHVFKWKKNYEYPY